MPFTVSHQRRQLYFGFCSLAAVQCLPSSRCATRCVDGTITVSAVACNFLLGPTVAICRSLLLNAGLVGVILL
ncbi:hypothetical protein C8R44DRAFT_814048 [Mycena epipterygia]|nr:hypothetical protein C8R44DRAFT_814048 [Mycena epipterygia]